MTKKKTTKSKKTQTPAEKQESILSIVGLIVSLITVYYMYDLIINPIGNIFGLGQFFKIGLAIFEFFVAFGLWGVMMGCNRIL